MSKLENFNGNRPDGPAPLRSSIPPEKSGGRAYLGALIIATLLMILAPMTYLFVNAVQNWPSLNLTLDRPSELQNQQ